MMSLETRTAIVADLDAIVDVFLRCWRESYAGVLPPEVIAVMDDMTAYRLWATVFSKPGRVLVAESQNRVLGITRFLVSQDASGYVASLYVSPDSQEMGVGRALLAAAEAELLGQGARTATLWVFQDNAASIAFYRSRGWEPDGKTRIEAQFGAVEVRLAKVLG